MGGQSGLPNAALGAEGLFWNGRYFQLINLLMSCGGMIKDAFGGCKSNVNYMCDGLIVVVAW